MMLLAAHAALAGCGGGRGSEAALPPVGAGPPAPTSTPVPVPPGSGTDFRVAALGAGAALNGARAFPADNAWNRDISAAPVDPLSDSILATIGLDTALHADFGAGLYQGAPIGIPYVVVAGAQAPVAIHFTAYGDESEPGLYPVPANAPIEGGPSSSGDRHVLVIDRDHNKLYELHTAYPDGDGSWNAGCGAVFQLDGNTVRPGGQPGWTSGTGALREGGAGRRRHPPRAALHRSHLAPRLCAAGHALGPAVTATPTSRRWGYGCG